jgi:hypothetical protein
MNKKAEQGKSPNFREHAVRSVPADSSLPADILQLERFMQ